MAASRGAMALRPIRCNLSGCTYSSRDHGAEQVKMRRQAGDSWVDLGLVFCTR
jgi:hypothetical protein